MGPGGGAEWGGQALTFRFADPHRRLAGVRLWQHAGMPGDRLEFSYRDPEWVLTVPAPDAWRLEYQLERPAREGSWRELTVPAPALGAEIHVRLWSPKAGAGERLLVANDGPEYDKLADLSQYSASGASVSHHLALLAPGERDNWYSA